MSTFYDNELQKVLIDYIKSTDIEVITDASPYFELIEERFPLAMNRIDWQTMSDHIYVNLQGLEMEQKSCAVQSFIEELEKKLKNQFVIIVGDGAQEHGYRLQLNFLKDVVQYFFDLPQHTFVLFEDSQACLNRTFEDEIFFWHIR